MSLLQRAENLISEMSSGEKAQLLMRVAMDISNTSPGIESRPNVCGGEPCILRTRIPVWLLVRAREFGTSEAELLQAYPTLVAEDLANAWNYYRANPIEIQQQIEANETD